MPSHFTALAFTSVLALCFLPTAVAEDKGVLPWISTDGIRFAKPDGETARPKSRNTGNWLLLERWMLTIDHGQFADEYSFQKNLEQRFDKAKADRLMEIYRENWLTPSNFENIRCYGFNTIRLPFNYRLLEDNDRPGILKPDVFKWLNRAIEMCEDAGLQEVKYYFKWFGTMQCVIDEPMREALTRADTVGLDLPMPPPPTTITSYNDDVPGRPSTDIGGALSGGQKLDAQDAKTIYGGGRDIWRTADEFRLVWREFTGDFVFTATIDSLPKTRSYSKAGLMARADLSTESAHTLLHVFPIG